MRRDLDVLEADIKSMSRQSSFYDPPAGTLPLQPNVSDTRAPVTASASAVRTKTWQPTD